jgi:uncharacterized membrane protein
MKLTQINNQLEIKTSSVGVAVTGIVFIIVGILLAIFILNGFAKKENGEPESPWVSLFGLVFVVIGYLLAWFAKNKKTVLQQGANTIVSVRRVLGGKTDEQSFPTANITAVQLYTYMDNTINSSSSPSRRSTLSLLLNNNDIVELGSAGKNGFTFNGMNMGNLIRKAPLSKEANQVATFLGVPLQSSDVSSIPGAVQSIKQAFQGRQSRQTPPTVSQSPPASNPSAQTTQWQQGNQPAPPSQKPPLNQPPAGQ